MLHYSPVAKQKNVTMLFPILVVLSKIVQIFRQPVHSEGPLEGSVHPLPANHVQTLGRERIPQQSR